MRHTTTIPVTVTFSESERPFDDSDIMRRMKTAADVMPSSRLLSVAITSKKRDPDDMRFIFTGELTFGRWFPFRLTEKSA